MGKLYDEIDQRVRAFIEAQHMFFVATAPATLDGHVNLSPKGLDSFAVLGPREVAYLDLTGSGAETIAHVRENGRIVLMFCAFSGAPKIVRLHGTAGVVTPASGAWPALRASYPEHLGARAIIDVQVTRISDSCGYGVPAFSGAEERAALPRWAANKGAEGLRHYRREHNSRSIDGLPALEPAGE